MHTAINGYLDTAMKRSTAPLDDLGSSEAEMVEDSLADIPALTRAMRTVLDLHAESDVNPDECARCQETSPCAEVQAVSNALGLDRA